MRKARVVSQTHGFTLIEVMLAVCILALVATASLKLVVLSQNSLRAAKDQEEFLMSAQKIRAKVLAEETAESGSEEKLSWNTEIKKKEFFGEDFGKLDFGRNAQMQKADAGFSWRELEITETETDKKMKIVLPNKRENNN